MARTKQSVKQGIVMHREKIAAKKEGKTERKKPRTRPGTTARRDIRELQASNNLVLAKAVVQRKISSPRDTDPIPDGRASKGYRRILHRLLEHQLVALDTRAQEIAISNNRITVQPRDIIRAISGNKLMTYALLNEVDGIREDGDLCGIKRTHLKFLKRSARR